MKPLRPFALCLLLLAGPSYAVSFTEWLAGCSHVKQTRQLVTETESDRRYYTLLPWEEFVPRFRFTYAQRQLIAGPVNNFNFGMQGQLANPVRLLALIDAGDALGTERVSRARAEESKAIRLWVERFFEWQSFRTVAAQLGKSETLLAAYAAGKDKAVSTEMLGQVSDALALINELNESRFRSAELQSLLEGCANPLALSQVEVPRPTRQTLEQAGERFLRDPPEDAECRAQIARDQARVRADKWAWLPSLVYSYSKALPLANNTFIFTEWFVGAEMTIPFSAFAAPSPTVSACEVQKAAQLEKNRELVMRARAALDNLDTFDALSERLSLAADALRPSLMAGSVSAPRYLDMLREWVRLHKTVRESKVAVYQVWFSGGQP